MDLRWLGSVALLAVISVAAIFLFPVAHGSYSATHGPTTTLRWRQLRAILMFVMSAAAFAVAQMLALLLRAGKIELEPAAVPASLLASNSPLRR